MDFPPEWHALGREAELAAEQIASGVTALGRANHAARGYYTQGLFGLSIGIERLAKLVIVTDHALTNAGTFPNNEMLRKYGHDIRSLLRACELLAAKYLAGKEYCDRPNSPIHQGIVTTLAEFAELSRYYNLDLIGGGKAARLPEPVGAWWQRVAIPILDAHYSPQRRAKDRARAAMIGEVLGDFTSVLHHTEQGEVIDTVEALSERADATAVVQKYGRLHVLQLVRWLSSILSEISHAGAYKARIQALLGLDEPFVLFGNDDKYLRDRKTWSIYRP
jgi:hypothetical protein